MVAADPVLQQQLKADPGLAAVPTVCLFVRPENVAAIRVYDGIGMRRTISYRSLVF